MILSRKVKEGLIDSIVLRAGSSCKGSQNEDSVEDSETQESLIGILQREDSCL